MTYHPSEDPAMQRTISSELWAAIEKAFDNAAELRSLPRGNTKALLKWYVRSRSTDSNDPAILTAYRSRLPPSFESVELGQTDIDVLDLILNMDAATTLALVGPPGCGKSTLLHFIEVVARQHSPTTIAFIFFDGLRLEVDASVPSCLNLLAQDVGQFSARESAVDDRLRAELSKVGQVLTADPTYATLRDAFDKLGRWVSGQSGSIRVVVVFDNLDHLSRGTFNYIAEIAKQIQQVGGASSLMSMRPAGYKGAAKKGNAGALFSWYTPVAPPQIDAWLERFGERLAEQIRAKPILKLSAHGVSLTPDVVTALCGRLAELLRRRRAGDDCVKALGAASARNVRHMILLLRRILQHRTLPSRFLLGLEPDCEFHPLTAMFEGDRLMFVGDPLVPNLLAYRTEEGTPVYTLQHRILLFAHSLGTNNRIAVSYLRELLGALQLADSSFESCLVGLSNAKLLTGSDVEVFAVDDLPEDIVLTEAGSYYVDHLLRYSDYLLCAVLDVALKHEKLRQDGVEPFSSKLESLLEYAEALRKREQHEVTLLVSSRTVAARRVARVLASGGLLSRSVLAALQSLLRRATRASAEAQKQVDALSKWVERAEQRLEEITEGGVQNDKKMDERGLDLPNIVLPHRCGLLIIDAVGGDLRVCFRVMEGRRLTSYEVGRCPQKELLEWVRPKLEAIGGLVTTGVRFRDNIRGFGRVLAQRVLTTAGQNVLAAHVKLIDRLAIITEETSVPWEWLLPPSFHEPPLDCRNVHEMWRTMRWPGDFLEGAISALNSDVREGAVGTILTVGLEPDNDVEYDIGKLRESADRFHTIHIVGVQKEDGIIVGPGLKLDAEVCQARPLRGHDVILSSCGAGAMKCASNVAGALAVSCDCVVWAPLVSIRDSQAKHLDSELRSFQAVDAHESLDTFMRARQRNDELFGLYVRYGLARP